MFKRVHDYLEKDGLFVFDINTIYKFQNILSDNSFCETTENSAYTWENYYDEEERINEFYTFLSKIVTAFMKDMRSFTMRKAIL